MKRLARSVGAAFVLALLVPAAALAHPLGNFTINHYAGVRVEPGRVVLDVVIDEAEIPAYQEKLRIDRDGDGKVSDAELANERTTACPRLSASLSLAIDGAPAALAAAEAGLSFPPGAAGLDTMRLVCVFQAALQEPLGAGTTIAFRDTSYAERIGWREIVVTGSGVTVDGGDLPATSVSDRLRSYPKDLIAQPLDVRSASFAVSPGGPILAPLEIPDATPLAGTVALYASGGGSGSATGAGTLSSTAAGQGAVPGGVGSEISGLLETRDLTPLVLVGSILAAMALGAGHALTPGHGKTLMGAYLVGTRGTARHAIALGLSVTASHTLGILVLAAIVLGFRDVISPEAFNRVAPVASGLLVLGIGGWLLIGQLRSRRSQGWIDHRHRTEHTRETEQSHETEYPHEGIHEQPHPGDHDHDHDHGAAHPHDHGEAHPHVHDSDHRDDVAAGTHSHGGLRHSHVPASRATLTWRSLFVLGLAGGIIPSTNALIILLATIATGRAAYGFALVVGFGLGMACVLGGVGLALVLARDRVDRLPDASRIGRFAPLAPLASGVVVLTLGVYLTTTALGFAPTF
jgi:nickel/cobalt transporter (NicO) family protein